MKRLDWYIVKKFLGTFFFSIVLVLSIAIVFDLTEKMDDFFEEQVPFREIILDYYLPFLPYYMNMFSSLFIFISVIFFTSKLAGNSEIIAMHATGMSYHRMMRPYAFSAAVLFLMICPLLRPLFCSLLFCPLSSIPAEPALSFSISAISITELSSKSDIRCHYPTSVISFTQDSRSVYSSSRDCTHDEASFPFCKRIPRLL